MRIVCASDLHGIDPLPEIPRCDLLLIAGDIEDAHLHPHDTSSQIRYVSSRFASWLAAAPARHKIGIAGNHDFLGIRAPEVLRALPWIYLCDESVELDGLVLHGSPWTPPFFDWAFMASEADLAGRWQLVPESCDILITHGPPYGLGDDVGDGYGRDPHQGSTSLRAFVEQHPTLRLHVFGHIHEGYGQGILDRAGLTPLRYVNAARVDREYRPVNAPVVVDL